jgi:hypothetical protein
VSGLVDRHTVRPAPGEGGWWIDGAEVEDCMERDFDL